MKNYLIFSAQNVVFSTLNTAISKQSGTGIQISKLKWNESYLLYLNSFSSICKVYIVNRRHHSPSESTLAADTIW